MSTNVVNFENDVSDIENQRNCVVQDTTRPFRLNIKTNAYDDKCYLDVHTAQSRGPGDYHLSNHFQCECNIPDAVEVVASGNGVSAYFRFLGTPIGVQSRLDETRRTLKSSNTQHMETLGSNEATEAWQGITDFGWENAEELLLRFGCLPSRTAALAEMVSSILSKEDLEITIVAGPGRGVLVCTISTASNNNDQVVALIERLRTSAALLDGYVVAEKCSQEIKQRLDVWGFPGDTLSLMRRLKKQVDPRNTLNRGRFLWGIAV